jgi:hypothetical protein
MSPMVDEFAAFTTNGFRKGRTELWRPGAKLESVLLRQSLGDHKSSTFCKPLTIAGGDWHSKIRVVRVFYIGRQSTNYSVDQDGSGTKTQASMGI